MLVELTITLGDHASNGTEHLLKFVNNELHNLLGVDACLLSLAKSTSPCPFADCVAKSFSCIFPLMSQTFRYGAPEEPAAPEEEEEEKSSEEELPAGMSPTR